MGVIVEESTDLETNLAAGQKPNLLKNLCNYERNCENLGHNKKCNYSPMMGGANDNLERNISLPGMISVATVQEYFVDNSCEEEQGWSRFGQTY